MTLTAAELVASKKHILLDFDGPVCAAFAGYGAENISRQLATLMAQEGADVPAELFNSPDPFELLRFAANLGDPYLVEDVDIEFRRLEVLAVRLAVPTSDAADVVRLLADAGHTVTIVSNNSTDAITQYARAHRLAGYLSGITGRCGPDPSLLKPSPHLLQVALEARGASPDDAVMVGDSATDIEAAHAAGLQAIAFANKLGKISLLGAAGPGAIIGRMRTLLPSSLL